MVPFLKISDMRILGSFTRDPTPFHWHPGEGEYIFKTPIFKPWWYTPWSCQFEPLKFLHATFSGWWFQTRFLMFTPWEKWSNLMNIFEMGLKSPTRCWKVSLWASMSLGHGEVVTQAESNLGFFKAQGWGHSYLQGDVLCVIFNLI